MNPAPPAVSGVAAAPPTDPGGAAPGPSGWARWPHHARDRGRRSSRRSSSGLHPFWLLLAVFMALLPAQASAELPRHSPALEGMPIDPGDLWDVAAADTVYPAGGLHGRVRALLGRSGPTPAAGISVSVAGSPAVILTDDDGRFRLRGLPPGSHRLQFRVLGCLVSSEDVEIPAGEEVELEVLVRPVIELEGFLVQGQGWTQDPGTPAEGASLRPRPGSSARSIEQMIRGAFPGVRVVRGSGLPGSDASIQFRGPTSVSGGEGPLIVVDGSPVAGGAVDLNPDDVEEIKLLRGASAAALYGSRGQAGVIEIRTRRGSGRQGAAAPLVLVDGVVTPGGLADVETSQVLAIEVVPGASAALVLGRSVMSGGVLHVTTTSGATGGDPALQYCPGGR